MQLLLMESWQMGKEHGSTFPGSLDQTVMFHRCVREMNMNWSLQMNEIPDFILAGCPQGNLPAMSRFIAPRPFLHTKQGKLVVTA